MKSLVKVVLILASVFAMTFVIAKFTGFLNLESIENLLSSIQTASPLLVGGIIAALLFADLFIAVPTLSICILAGFFLGFYQGVLFASVGVIAAGCVGYLLSYLFGERIIAIVLRDPQEREELVLSFQNYGLFMILLSRATPILPEVTACLSGMTKMRFSKFLVAWLISSIPYVALASYAGSIISLENPQPAIFTAIGLTLFFALCWYFLRRRLQKTAMASAI